MNRLYISLAISNFKSSDRICHDNERRENFESVEVETEICDFLPSGWSWRNDSLVTSSSKSPHRHIEFPIHSPQYTWLPLPFNYFKCVQERWKKRTLANLD